VYHLIMWLVCSSLVTIKDTTSNVEDGEKRMWKIISSKEDNFDLTLVCIQVNQ